VALRPLRFLVERSASAFACFEALLVAGAVVAALA
jgi:hypothetical protein